MVDYRPTAQVDFTWVGKYRVSTAYCNYVYETAVVTPKNDVIIVDYSSNEGQARRVHDQWVKDMGKPPFEVFDRQQRRMVRV